LHAFERAGKAVDYYALDLSLPELKRSLSAACQDDYQHVKFRGLHGTYDDGLAWLKRPESAGRPRLILSLGSSIGNFPRADAAGFLKGFSDVLNVDSKMLIGLDACQDRDTVWHGYNDKEGKTREFYLNGLVHANKLFGEEVFRLEEWDVIGEYDEVEHRHQAFYTPLVDTNIEDVHLPAGERVRFEESYKYSRSQSAELWDRAGLAPQGVFGNSTDDYRKLHFCILPPLDIASLNAKATYCTRLIRGYIEDLCLVALHFLLSPINATLGLPQRGVLTS
jgi:L-histidine Nalpha-methyltransferase / hercynylcysteine S-oxide synthase